MVYISNVQIMFNITCVCVVDLFSLAHKLVDLYPDLAIAWFAVGCYYYVIGKCIFSHFIINF